MESNASQCDKQPGTLRGFAVYCENVMVYILRKQHCDTNETAKLITHEFTSMSNLNLLTLQVKNREIVLY